MFPFLFPRPLCLGTRFQGCFTGAPFRLFPFAFRLFPCPQSVQEKLTARVGDRPIAEVG
jgi:hypothetical protein